MNASTRLGYYQLAIVILLLGFVLRVIYLHQSHPYVDEYFTLLASRAVQRHGYPLLPSGLFYSHGLLYTYLIALIGWLMTLSTSLEEIVAVELVYQIPNLFLSGLALAMIYTVTKRWFGQFAGLVAMVFLAVYPYGIVWGARIRMYTLLFFFVPLLAYLFYRAGRHPGNRWLSYALLGLLVGVLTHNWLVLMIPVLTIGAGFVLWHYNRASFRAWRWWLPGLVMIVMIIALSSYLQSFWLDQPDMVAQQQNWSQGIVEAIRSRLNPFNAVTGNAAFLKEFIWQNPFNLVVLVGVLLGTGGLGWLFQTRHQFPSREPYLWSMLYLYLLFWGSLAEVLFLIGPELKQARYASPLMILVFIIIGGWLSILLQQYFHQGKALSPMRITIPILLVLLLGFGFLSIRQLPRLFFEGLPPVAYNEAFQFVRSNSIPTDAVLTPLPAAAALYLNNPTYFIAQNATYTFVQTNTQGILADRWLGAPWLNNPEQLKETLKTYPTVWLVTDQFSFNTQFDSEWKQLMRYNTTKVWEEDGVMVFQGQGLVRDIPTQPETRLEVRLADVLELVGYTRRLSAQDLELYLFWQVAAPLSADYTTFVHLRNSAGKTVAQVDVQPLKGEYPTSRWRVGELIVDEVIMPLPINLPPDTYRLLVGLYRWDTLERLAVVHDRSGENAIELESVQLKQ